MYTCNRKLFWLNCLSSKKKARKKASNIQWPKQISGTASSCNHKLKPYRPLKIRALMSRKRVSLSLRALGWLVAMANNKNPQWRTEMNRNRANTILQT